MKVIDIRRKLIATLAAGGMLSASAAQAANLDVNLVVNGGFESVDFGTLGASSGPLLNDWAGQGFTYSHDGSGGVPNYANGTPLANGGSYYFAPASTTTGGTPHHTLATAITQSISVAAGPTGSLIATGNAKFSLSAYFNSYQTQADFGTVQVDFLNGANAVLGTGVVSPGAGALSDWTKVTATGAIPTGTATVKVSAWGALLQGGGSDGYIDNIDFQVASLLAISVNRSTGAITLLNQTGSSKNLSGYSITSASESLAPASWLSITDNYDSGNAGPNQVDPTHDWAESSAANDFTKLAESDPSNAGGALANGRQVNLGSAWVQNPTEDLRFEYTSGGQLFQGSVEFVGGPGGGSLIEGDLNIDGAINAADWAIVRANQHVSLAGKSLAQAYRLGDFNGDLANNHADFVEFKNLYDAANGVGAFAVMVASVPEPTSLAIASVATVLIVGCGRRTKSIAARR